MATHRPTCVLQASKHSVPLAKHSVPVAKHSVPVAKHSVPIAKPTANGTISAAKPANSAPKPGNAPTKPSSAGGSSKPRETAGTPAVATSAADAKPAKPPDGAQTAAATASQPAQAPAQLAAGAGRPPAAASRPAEAASAAAAEPAAGRRTADGATEQPGAEALKTSSSGEAVLAGTKCGVASHAPSDLASIRHRCFHSSTNSHPAVPRTLLLVHSPYISSWHEHRHASGI